MRLQNVELVVPRFIIAILLFGLLSNCTQKNRKTTVYGKIVDDKGGSVASIPVIICSYDEDSVYKHIVLTTAYTDESGNYQVVLTPERKYDCLWTMVNPSLNSKFVYGLHESNALICPISIGDTNKCGFVLIAR